MGAKQKRQGDGKASSAKKKKQRGSGVVSTDNSLSPLESSSDEREDNNEGTWETCITTNIIIE
jgi:hypothetical protein